VGGRGEGKACVVELDGREEERGGEEVGRDSRGWGGGDRAGVRKYGGGGERKRGY